KVLAMAHETGLMDRIELNLVASTALEPDGELSKVNPLTKIPTLELDDGTTIFDSTVICEYLDTLHDGEKMIPDGERRWDTLVTQSIGNGIMEAAVGVRYEQALRPEERQWDVWMNAQFSKIDKALDVLETWRGARIQDIHVGSISVACALAYMDFRHGDRNWREGRPVLTQMLDTFSQRISMSETRPD
ncbi:MAG: glutathione S-transferase family protein, partial [Rhizobiaceae bacterium]|nr:glutathione S-transferase family protein [Rhizobiaceae bacterium]